MPPSGGDIRKIRGAPPKAIPMQTQGASRSSSELSGSRGLKRSTITLSLKRYSTDSMFRYARVARPPQGGALIFNEEKRIRTNPSQLKPTGPTMS